LDLTKAILAKIISTKAILAKIISTKTILGLDEGDLEFVVVG